MSIEAHYPAPCGECGGMIAAGDQITRDSAFARWRHDTCPATKFDFDPAEVCTECFTVRAANGKCAC